MKISEQGVMDTGCCKELQQLMSLPELRILQPGVSPLTGREGARTRAEVKYQHHVSPFVCLPCWCPLIRLLHLESQLWRFPNTSALGLSQGSSLSLVSGAFFGEAGVVNSTPGFPSFRNGLIR